jgi:hypothetical protein
MGTSNYSDEFKRDAVQQIRLQRARHPRHEDRWTGLSGDREAPTLNRFVQHSRSRRRIEVARSRDRFPKQGFPFSRQFCERYSLYL